MLRKVPLIVILGSTGTGKTKLSLELAERFGGEIISADSMQVYANLDIVTAKATKAEQSRVRHHLLDVATPTEPYTVVHFRNAALPIVEQLLAKAKPPLIVGGTNYYIESLLWDVLVSDEFDAHSAQADMQKKAVTNALTSAELAALTSEQLHKHLATFDAASATRIHPNNRRKIIRAIEFYQTTGLTLSEKLNSQRQQPGGNRLGGPLRYEHTILLWLRCQQDELNARLEKRVDDMIAQGLLSELRAFHNKYNANGALAQAYTKGVLQTIGYKEFIPYLLQHDVADDARLEEYLRAHNYQMPSVTEDKKTDNAAWPAGLALLANCLSELKLVTQRYARKQIKWINNRFLASRDRQVPDVYELDTTVVQNWPVNVYARAVSIIDCYRNAQTCEVQPLAKRVHPGAGLDEETSHFCACCQRHFVGEFQWQLHMRSNKHKKRKESLRKQTQPQLSSQGETLKKEY